MEESIIEQIVFWVMGVIGELGYPGIFLLMAAESALIPIPSEIIMPFSGFLVTEGKFNFWAVVIVGAAGNLAGSWAAYALGYWGHQTLVKKLVRKYGKWILLTEDELDKAVDLFSRYGQWIAVIARVLPAIRTVISLPAGIARLSFAKFSALTFFGSLIWSGFLTYLGVLLGQNWQIARPYFRKFEIFIVAIFIILVGLYIYHKLRTSHRHPRKSEDLDSQSS